MKKTDIERMIALADDRYVDEIFRDNISGRRKNIVLTFTAVAAALALVAGGISYFVSNAGNADKITADYPAVSELGIVDYSLYFQNKDEFAAEVEGGGVLTNATGISCFFSDSEYVKSAAPFDMSRFANARCQFVYDHSDEVRGIFIHADNITEDKQENVKMLDVEVYERGELFPHLSLGKCKSLKRFDVDVYGFDFREEDNTVGVIFAMDGKEYLIGGNHMSFDEIGIIMDSIIENGIWTDSFDLSKAEVEYGDISADITLEEANMISPFAGHVPQIYKFGDMKLNYNKVSYYAGRDEANNIVPYWLYFAYYDDGEQDICLQYFTENANVQPLEKTVAIDDIMLDKLSEFRNDGNNHEFTVDFGGFKVNIWTNSCSDEELLSCLTAIRIGASGVETIYWEITTLAEANKIAPYEGYVPQNETAGDMKLGTVQYNGSNIVLDYSFQSENRFSYIGLTYTADKSMTENYSVITLEQLINRDIVIHNDDSEDGRNNYKFAVECTGLYGKFYVCVDSEKCTTAELYDCVLTRLMEKGNAGSGEKFDFAPFGTLEEADKLAPFAGYVPAVREIGDMKIYTDDGSEVKKCDSDEYGQVLNIYYQSDVTSGSTYGEYDYKVIAVTYTEKKAYNIPEAPVISIADAPVTELDKLKTDGKRGGGRVCYRFVIDCGSCYITVAADCLPEEMRDYLISLVMEKEFGAGNGGQDGTAVTFEEAKYVKPFDVYVPTRESGVLGLKKGVLNYYEGANSRDLHSMHLTFTDSYYNETLTLVYWKNNAIDLSDIPAENIIPIENIDWSTVNTFAKNNTAFWLDCGEVNIQAVPECSVEQAWFYIEQIKSSAMFDAAKRDGKLITLDKVKELAKKGDDLTWSDFEDYYGVDVGSGLYIMSYAVEGTNYSVSVGGGSLTEKPMYIYLSGNGKEKIDIRYDSVEEFLE